MFERNFSTEQSAAFLGLLSQLVMADGQISDEEQEKLNLFKDVFRGIEIKICPHEQLGQIFDSKVARSSAMLELISVAKANGNIVTEDRKFLNSLTASLFISDKEYKEMLSWIEKMYDLINQSQKFMED
jgi:uncharacterized tellurite resistance protein B-like protein